MVRLFVAVWPPDDLVETLWGLPRKNRPGVRWVDPDNWHTTLRFLGDADPDEVGERLDGTEFPTSTARYGPAIDVRWEKALVVPVAGLDAMAGAVGKATSDLGSDPAPRKFAGHLTIARLQRSARPPAVIGLPLSAVLEVAEVALVASTLRPGGPIYDTIATWPVPQSGR